MQFDSGEVSSLGDDLLRVVNFVSTNNESYMFWYSLLWAYVHYNLDVCHCLIFRN